MANTSFRDLEGNEWTIEPNFGTFAHIDEQCKVDLGNLEKFGEVWAKILRDDKLAEAVVWAAIEQRAEGGGIQGWRRVMTGDRLAAGVDALLEALCVCCPQKAALYRDIADRLAARLKAAYDEAAAIVADLPDDVQQLQRLADDLKTKIRRSR